jgi:hypothetical protein
MSHHPESDLLVGTSPVAAVVIYDPIGDERSDRLWLWCTGERRLKPFDRNRAIHHFTWLRDVDIHDTDCNRRIQEYRLVSPHPLQIGDNVSDSSRRAEELEWQVTTRGIDYLVHYTRRENLRDIFRHGILSRDEVERRKEVDPYFIAHTNDDQRLDRRRDAVCVSVTVTNRRQFARHLRAADCAAGWVVIKIDPSIIWKYPCMFFHTNAAAVGRWHADPESVEAFRRMFADPATASRLPQRGDSNRQLRLALDEQAEVLVCSAIPVSYIKAISIRSERELTPVMRLLPSWVPIVLESNLFPRMG